MTSPRFIRTDAAATLLSTSEEVVRRKLRSGELAGIKLGRTWRVDLWALGKEKAHGENGPAGTANERNRDDDQYRL